MRVELLTAAPARERSGLRRVLTALPIAYPDDETWALIDGWVAKASDAGQHFGVGDLLIAAMAAAHGAAVWSLDADFDRMARLKFVSMYGPQAPRLSR